MSRVEQTRSPRSTPVETNRRTLLLMVAVFGLAAAYLAWRIREGATGSSGASGQFLVVIGLLATLVAIQNAQRAATWLAGWPLIAAGSAVWAIAHALRSATGAMAITIYAGCVLLSAALLIGGCLHMTGIGRERGAWRQLVVDLAPPIVALLTTAWLIEIGPFVRDRDIARPQQFAAMLHGLAIVALAVVGLIGAMSWRRMRAHPAVQSVMAGLVIVAVADALWLQRWIDGDQGFGVLADVTFCIGFATIVIGGLQARLRFGSGDEKPGAPVVLPRLAQKLMPVSLLVLMALAGGQARWGELTAHGIEIATGAGLIVVLFAMLWEDLVFERESVLTEEIGNLSERIDGLISQVGRDPLTGLLNRRAYQDRLEHELMAGRRDGTPVAIALIDVDDFKLVNDTLGHAVGDQVLQAIASILIGVCRAGDVAARYAGDEFVMIFPGLDEATANRVCERIVEGVRRISDQITPVSGVTVSLSIGVAVTHRCRRSVAQLIAIADAAMYDAKERGKNRVASVDADTLVSAAYWGVEGAISAEARRPAGDRRATADIRQAV
jgi:diguanylate cyclase (GGDEF)-like protein